MRKLGLIALLLSMPAFATKPCPADRCLEGESFSAKKCSELSTWIAIGRIEAVEHHPNPPPVFKDFAVFTLRVTKWEKGARELKTIRFQVGWCDNAQQVPDDINRQFRFFGADDPAPTEKDARPHYLHFEPL